MKATHSRQGLALVFGAALLLSACGGGGSEAPSEERRQGLGAQAAGRQDLKHARLCDASGCYYAWQVVDSDGDGVCDADELVAGTDPYDALSQPALLVVAQLGGKAMLPSFEAGRGAFVVYPEKMQAQLQEFYKTKGVVEQMAAFPLGFDRADSLSRAGIDSDLIKKNGIDTEQDGFTIGLERPTDSGLPARRVGGIELRLISEGEPLEPLGLTHGAATKQENFKSGAEVKTYGDGFTRTRQSDGTIVWRNEENKITKVYPAAGKYTNPDADSGSTEPTAEQKEAFARLRGAAVRTIDGWEQPDFSDAKVSDPRSLIMLVDPLILDNQAMVFDVPRVTEAQPEVRPDLPHPGLPAGGQPGKPCTTGCVQG